VWPSVQGDREAYPERWLSTAASRRDGHGCFDRSGLGEGRVVAEANPSSRTLIFVRTQQSYAGRRSGLRSSPEIPAADGEQALKVVVVYQDPLTRYWAAELWGRVGRLIASGGIKRKSWRLSELTNAFAFAEAVQEAAEADVLVIAVRDTGDMPMLLHAWNNGWMPRRAGRAGALVALIGVPARPDALSGRAHEYLQAIARQAGLDFLPRERRLPEETLAHSTLPRMTPATDLTATWPGAGPSRGNGARVRWRLVE
jgi:hypothetical protein